MFSSWMRFRSSFCRAGSASSFLVEFVGHFHFRLEGLSRIVDSVDQCVLRPTQVPHDVRQVYGLLEFLQRVLHTSIPTFSDFRRWSNSPVYFFSLSKLMSVSTCFLGSYGSSRLISIIHVIELLYKGFSSSMLMNTNVLSIGGDQITEQNLQVLHSSTIAGVCKSLSSCLSFFWALLLCSKVIFLSLASLIDILIALLSCASSS